jgi:5-methylcytosine-specific restriction endonuclease McrA
VPAIQPSAHQLLLRQLRNDPEYRRLRQEYHDNVAEPQQLPCWLDGEPIDYSLPHDHPDAWSLDHAQPVSTHPHLSKDPNNFRSAHLDCNKRRGNDEPHLDIGKPSRIW